MNGGKILLTLLKTPIDFDNLFEIEWMWLEKLRLWSITTPKNLQWFDWLMVPEPILIGEGRDKEPLYE